jgi:hypothetical protein
VPHFFSVLSRQRLKTDWLMSGRAAASVQQQLSAIGAALISSCALRRSDRLPHAKTSTR